MRFIDDQIKLSSGEYSYSRCWIFKSFFERCACIITLWFVWQNTCRMKRYCIRQVNSLVSGYSFPAFSLPLSYNIFLRRHYFTYCCSLDWWFTSSLLFLFSQIIAWLLYRSYTIEISLKEVTMNKHIAISILCITAFCSSLLLSNLKFLLIH